MVTLMLICLMDPIMRDTSFEVILYTMTYNVMHHVNVSRQDWDRKLDLPKP
jgi:hypothetical protein